MEPADLVGDPPITVTDNGDGTATISVAVGTGSGQVAAGNHNHNGVYAPAAHTHASTDISDATAVGLDVLTAEDAATARAAIGAGTSDLELGTSGTTAAAGNHTHQGLMTGSATAVADSEAEDVPGLVADFNALLAALRSRGIITEE